MQFSMFVPSPLLDLVISNFFKKLLLLIKIIFYILVTCSALISILVSLGMLEHFTLGKMGMGNILLLNIGNLMIYPTVPTGSLKLGLFLFFFYKSVSFYEIHKTLLNLLDVP